MKVLFCDHYDSFSYLLLNQLKIAWEPILNSKSIEFKILKSDDPSIIFETHDILVFSPGPMTPHDTIHSLDLLKTTIKPVLGVCLGMQIINEYLGGRTIVSNQPLHGVRVKIKHNNNELYRGIPQYFKATRYNSLTIEESSLVQVTSRQHKTNEIMSIEYISSKTNKKWIGIQYHPESFLTFYSHKILHNILLELMPHLKNNSVKHE